VSASEDPTWGMCGELTRPFLASWTAWLLRLLKNAVSLIGASEAFPMTKTGRCSGLWLGRGLCFETAVDSKVFGSTESFLLILADVGRLPIMQHAILSDGRARS
jgi:hypothetical protein